MSWQTECLFAIFLCYFFSLVKLFGHRYSRSQRNWTIRCCWFHLRDRPYIHLPLWHQHQNPPVSRYQPNNVVAIYNFTNRINECWLPERSFVAVYVQTRDFFRSILVYELIIPKERNPGINLRGLITKIGLILSNATKLVKVSARFFSFSIIWMNLRTFFSLLKASIGFNLSTSLKFEIWPLAIDVTIFLVCLFAFSAS